VVDQKKRGTDQKRKKYAGKAATFVVKLPAYGQSQSVTLKSNGFLVVNFGV
jgi:hypothetical protein